MLRGSWSRKSRLSKELLAWSLISFCVSVLFYFGVLALSTFIIKNYYDVDAHMKRMESMYLDKLQKYITDNDISVHTVGKVEGWNGKNRNIYLKLFFNDTLIYDTVYGTIDYKNADLEKIKNFPEAKYQNLNMDGKNIRVLLSCGDFPSEIFANYCALVVSILLFFALLIVGAKIKIKYLVKLENELDLLSEDLNNPITVKGHDEIADVACGINLLRLSVIDKLNKEKLAHDANMNLVASLSHDIKTPLATIITYLEISAEKVQDDKKLKKYMDICLEKSNHLKDLSNELFEHFLLHSKCRDVTFETVNANELVVQMIEESIFDLEVKGVHVQRDISDVTSQLNVNIGLLHRLFNNIFSNINSYADLTKEIYLKYCIENKYLLVVIKNYKQQMSVKKSPSSVGLDNCKTIMEKHHGKLVVDEKEDTFSISLYFLLL